MLCCLRHIFTRSRNMARRARREMLKRRRVQLHYSMWMRRRTSHCPSPRTMCAPNRSEKREQSCNDDVVLVVLYTQARLAWITGAAGSAMYISIIRRSMALLYTSVGEVVMARQVETSLHRAFSFRPNSSHRTRHLRHATSFHFFLSFRAALPSHTLPATLRS